MVAPYPQAESVSLSRLGTQVVEFVGMLVIIEGFAWICLRINLQRSPVPRYVGGGIIAYIDIH